MTPEEGYAEAERRIAEAADNNEYELDLSQLGLAALPSSLAKMTSLAELDLSGNKLKELPGWIGDLTCLDTLKLGKNNLTGLPGSFARLKQLQQLLFSDLPTESGNPLEELPHILKQLPQLFRLDLDFCGLNEIPPWISDMEELSQLYVSDNNLKFIPDSIGELKKLEAFECNRNKLRSLPVSLGKLKSIEELLIDENPLNPELAAAEEEGTAAVLAYLRQLAEDGEPLYEAKLILVGEGEVGKSSLLGALRADPWEEGRDTTHGIEIKQVPLAHPTEPIEMTLNGRDFGGQPVYRPTHQLFFSAPVIYLVVWKPREGPELGQVSEWIKLIKNRAGDTACILVVATHGGPDQRQAHIDEDALCATFGEMIAGFYHVDSKPSGDGTPGVGIEELKEKIAELAADLPEMGRDYPKRWENCRRSILLTEVAYISHDEFEKIAADKRLRRRRN